MKQSRFMSFVEANANLIVGLAVSYVANATVLPMFGLHISAAQNVGITAIYTIISLVRSYTLRRWFESRRASA